MKELNIGNECNPLEYIVTFKDGKQIRMLLDAEEYKHIEQLISYIDRTNIINICAYGSKDLYCQGA